MATVYVSYRTSDGPIVRRLGPLLEARHVSVKSDQGLEIGVAWRDHLMEELLTSDAVLVIWSEATLGSQFVAAEVGTARATEHLRILPVVIGDTEIPPFLQDLMVHRIIDPTQEALEALADAVKASIDSHLERRDRHTPGRPKVFVSHRHKDEEIVRALIECVRHSFHIDRHDIRCTSVEPYRLRVGDDSAERLRDEVADAEVVLGILTRDTLESSYVAFELGAAWGRRVWTCPLLARGADQANIPDPIRDLSPLFLTNERDCRQLLEDLARSTSLAKRKTIRRDELAKSLRRLVATAAGPAPDAPPLEATVTDGAR